MAAYIFKNLAAGAIAPEGQLISLKIKEGLRNEEWELRFGQQIRYEPQTKKYEVRFVPRGAPDMRRATLTADSIPIQDVTFWIIESTRYVNALAYVNYQEANRKANAFPILRPYL